VREPTNEQMSEQMSEQGPAAAGPKEIANNNEGDKYP
jgi:hypothetical protein